MTCIDLEIENIDINASRNGYKWTIRECLQLEREYDLLKLSVPEMAILHKRTVNAIMFKLQAENLDTFNNLYVKTYGQYYIDNQIDKLNNLFSTNEDDEDEDYEEEDEDYEEDDEDDEDNQDDDQDEDENEANDVSNRSYVFQQVKLIHNHISNLLNYFTNGTVKKEPQLNCH